MQSIKFKLVGTRPLLMHSDRFSDPLDPLTKKHKELTAKRKKTDEDHEAIAYSEWRGGIHWAEDIGPYLPGINIESCMIDGAKLSRLGVAVKRSVEVWEDRCRLEYKGPRDIDGLWTQGFYDARSVVVQRARLMRYRPCFTDWSVECTVVFDPQNFNPESVVKCMVDGGKFAGLGDFRPKFGRFDVEVIE